MSRLIPAVLLLLVTLFYLPSVAYDFVWDDHPLLLEDERVTGAGDFYSLFASFWSGTRETAPGSAQYSRPLVTLSFRTQYALHGPNPSGFHFFNVGLHAVCVLLLYQLLKTFVKSMTAAALGAAFFAVFPTQVEPVVWVSGRTDLMACTFGLAAWICIRRARELDRYATAAGLLLLLALFSKEIGWVFPVLVLADEHMRRKTGEPDAQDAPRLAGLRWLPMVGAMVVGASTRLLGLSELPSPDLGSGMPGWAIPLRILASTGYYVKLLVWPWNPSVLPAPRALPPPTSPVLWAGLVMAILTPVLIWKLFRKPNASGAIGLLWITVGLLPVINLVPLAAPSPVAERFWYMPLGGVALLLASAISAHEHRRAWVRPVLCLMIVALGTASLARQPDWTNDRTLWEAEARRHGLRHPLAAWNLGVARQRDGDEIGAEAVWREALRRGLGGGSLPYYNMGIDLCRLLLSQNRPEEAAQLSAQLVGQAPPPNMRATLEAIRKEATLTPSR